jgi:hypothetical protein
MSLPTFVFLTLIVISVKDAYLEQFHDTAFGVKSG